MTDHLAISEVFGPTVQGEGPSVGRLAGFVRVGRCNLACVWCDAAYTWDWKGVTGTTYTPQEEVTRWPIDDVDAAVEAMGVPLVVLTGGEPLLQDAGLSVLAGRCVARGSDVEVETNGTRTPSDALAALARFNVSPKLAHSQAGTEAQRIVPDTLRALDALPGTSFKFVVASDGDLDEIADIVDRVGLDPRKVWVMPEGTDPAGLVEQTARYADKVIGHGWNLTTRLHVLAWGNERGR